MSTTIDERVVEMRFDNAHFEKNVQTSLNTIDKLKDGLNLTGATKGLENISNAAKNCDMSSLSNSVDTVGLKFNAMYTIADQALRNITNSAMTYGKRIVSALTIDPIKTGFSEYETKINAIQTIMSNTASKGTTMEDVTKVIGELNTYADKTIYNFAEMTRNIGTFTAAGVGLEDSASAIQGIANLAASSGSTSQQASTAMYQLSQALAAGQVKLMDWNSVVNAGMGGQKFQDALKATAKEYGTDVDALIEKNGSFRESLKEGWITADVLNTTLKKFTTEGAKEYAESMVASGKYTKEQADALIKEAQAMEDAATKVKTFTQLWDTLKESAQSGWSQTWEIIVGDFEEAKETLTKFSDAIGGMIGKSADARNKLLQGWKDAGGRVDLLDSIYNIGSGIMSIVRPIKEAFRDIFPATTVEKLVSFTEGLKNLTSKFKLSETASENLKRTFKGLFAILGIAKEVISAIIKAIGPLFGKVTDLGGGLLEITAVIGDFLVKIHDAIKSSGILTKVFGGISTVIGAVITAFSRLVGFISKEIVLPGWEAIKSILQGISEKMNSVRDAASDMKDGVSGAVDDMSSAFANSGFVKMLESVWNVIKKVGSGIAKVFGALFEGLVGVTDGLNFNTILDFINALSVSGIAVFIAKITKGFSDLVGSVSDFKDGLLDIVDSVGDCFGALANAINAEALKKIAVAIAILAGALLVLSMIDGEKLNSSLGAITVLFTELFVAMAILTKTMSTSLKSILGIKMAVSSMTSIAIAVLILAVALKQLGDLDIEQITTGLIGIAGLMAMLIAAVKILGSGDKAIIKGATQMVIFATAIKILASACKSLSSLDWDELAKGLVGVGVLLAEVSLFMNTAKFSGRSITTATGIVILAAAIKVLASACKDFGQMKWEQIENGLLSIGILLAEIALFTKLTGNAKHVISTGVALIAIAAAVKIFASAIKYMSTIPFDNILDGLIAIAGVLGIVTIALNLMPRNLIGKGVGLIAVATALIILGKALESMSNMSWSNIAKGFVALGGSMAILAVGLHAMNGTLSGVVSLLAATAALTVLVPVMSLLSLLSWGGIAKGLVAIAGAFTIMGIAGHALKGVVPTIMALSVAMVIFGAGVLAVGAGLLAFGAGLSAIAVGFTAIVASLSSVVTGIVSVVGAFVKGLIKGIGEGIVAFCEVISDGMPAIGKALKAIITTVVEILVDCVPQLVDGLLQCILSVLKALTQYAPTIVEFVFDFIVSIIQALADKLPDLIKAVVSVFSSLFTGVVEALKEIDTSTLLQAIAGIGMIAGLVMLLGMITPYIPSAMVGVLGMGVIIAELSVVLAAIGALAQIPGLEWLISEGGHFLKTVGTAIGEFIGGIAGGVAQGITNSLPQIGSDLSAFMTNVQPFIDGASKIDSSVLSGVMTLVGVVLALTAANVIDSLTSWFTGGASLADFGAELAEFAPNFRAYADAVNGIDASAVEASANAAKALTAMASSIPNSGGLLGLLAGENNLGEFAAQLVPFGESLKAYSLAVAGVNAEAIQTSSEAAKSLVEMVSLIPNEGGLVAWITGDNSVAKFGSQLVTLGEGLKGFSDATAGIVPENIVAVSDASKHLVDMVSNIPNEGGIVAWFTGENSITKFAGQLPVLGQGLKGFSDSTAGIVPENIIAAANAAKAIAEMANVIPNEGGIVSWFTGDNNMADFASKFPELGSGLKAFSDSIAGIVPENVTAAANAAKAIAEMTNVIPNEGGVVAWFAGESSISKFGMDIVTLGQGLKGFSEAVAGIVPENITSAANAGKSLAEMTAFIPTEGGVKAWFAGELSISKFASELPVLGQGLKGFSENTAGLVPENITAAASAAKALAEMTAVIPKEGGIKAWFTGESSISKFADQLPKLGDGLKGFSDSVDGIVPENVTAAANAAKALGQMTDIIPKKTDKICDFGENLETFGGSLSTYFSNTKDITQDAINISTNAINAIKQASSLDGGNLTSAAKGILSLVMALKKMSGIKEDVADGFVKAIKSISESSVSALTKVAEDIEKAMKNIGKDAVDAFVEGFNENTKSATKACKSLASDCADALESKSSEFNKAGANLVKGFANGISANAYKAIAKARAMAAAAISAAKKALDINSPSKVFYEIGEYTGEGFVTALDSYSTESYNVGSHMANSAKSGLRDTIARIQDVIDGDIDVQPTIRPVLDLSDVRSGASAISSMFRNGTSVGVMANVRSISSMMNQQNQNGVNSDIISAIDDLRKDLKNIETTTNIINGITYDDGSNITDAVQALIRAARVERRV